jgi:hypothetical protein
MEPQEVADVLAQPLSRELLSRSLARLAFVAPDGTPRAIPIGFRWTGTSIVMCTAKNARKLRALHLNPAVALTIDTEVHPPHVLLIRGDAVLDAVDGIPEEYMQMSGAYSMTDEQRAGFEGEVRATYVNGMVRIVVNPTWAKVLDFESTLPTALQELAQRRATREVGEATT